MKVGTGFGVMQFSGHAREHPDRLGIVLIAQTTCKSRNALAIGIRFSYDSRTLE